MATTLQSIEAILTWYQANGATQSIENLLDAQDKLSIHSYRLAEIAGQSKSKYNSSYFIRKISVAKSTHAMQTEKVAYNKAENKAMIENELAYQNEINTEAEAYTSDLLLKQVNKVIASMSQRISYLKHEKQRTQTQAGR